MCTLAESELIEDAPSREGASTVCDTRPNGSMSFNFGLQAVCLTLVRSLEYAWPLSRLGCRLASSGEGAMAVRLERTTRT